MISQSKNKIILGIETSCDETAAAVVRNGTEVVSNVVASSAQMHIKTGGIIPEVAARQQVNSIIPVIEEALMTGLNWKPSEKSTPAIDAIAVTSGGPGLIGSMLVGVETAKTLSFIWNKPIVPVIHLFAHVYANWLTGNNPEFPAVVLTAAGGHSDILLMKKHGIFLWLGGTRDDSAGEAFDKTARLLGLPYPGGPAISADADLFFQNNEGVSLKFFPRPLSHDETLDLSFSGLKTAVIRDLEGQSLRGEKRHKMAAEIQEAIVDSLVQKTLAAARIYKPRSILVAGGVAANKRLKEKFIQALSLVNNPPKLFIPPPKLCTDNATFIASNAYFNYKSQPWHKITVNLDPYSSLKNGKN